MTFKNGKDTNLSNDSESEVNNFWGKQPSSKKDHWSDSFLMCIGAFVSIFTPFILGFSSHMMNVIADISGVYLIFVILINSIFCKLKGYPSIVQVRNNNQLPPLMKFFDKFFSVVAGHALGFITMSYFWPILLS